jgi:hypothetical protein
VNFRAMVQLRRSVLRCLLYRSQDFVTPALSIANNTASSQKFNFPTNSAWMRLISSVSLPWRQAIALRLF